MTPKQEAALRLALKLALEALEDTLSGDLTPYQAAKTITAIREALAEQPAQPYPDNFIDALKYDVARRDSEAQQQKSEWMDWSHLPMPDELLHEKPAPVAKPHEQQEPVAIPGPDAERIAVLLDKVVRQYAFKRGTEGYEALHLARRIACRYTIKGDPPLYTSPPASKPWQGLTDEERDYIWHTVGNSDAHGDVDGWSGRDVMDAIEAKLREKNNG